MEKKNNIELLEEFTLRVQNLRDEYGKVVKQIEELMFQNSQTPIMGYQSLLDKLISQRDEITKQMQPLIRNQQIYQKSVSDDQAKEQQAIISQVEKLLNIRIDSVGERVIDPNKFNGVPQMISKDKATLRKEQATIIQKLDDLNYEGIIDFKTLQKMKKAVRNEYDKFVQSAPVPASQTTEDTKPIEETQTATNSDENFFDNKFDEKYGTTSTQTSKEKNKQEILNEKRKELRRVRIRKFLEERYGENITEEEIEEIIERQEKNDINNQSVDYQEFAERSGRRMM